MQHGNMCVIRRGSGLDILTPRGQRTLQDEKKAAARFCAVHPGLSYIHTKKRKPVGLDAFIVKDDEIIAAVECKCRYDVTLEEFCSAYHSEWLVTFDKLVTARALAMAFHVPLYGFVYLVNSDRLLVQQLTHLDGDWLCDMKIMRTVTQRTVNGGTATRANAFVCMRGAKEI